MQKKITALILLGILSLGMVACNSNNSDDVVEPEQEVSESVDAEDKELEEIKRDAVEVNFVEANAGNIDNAAVVAEGTVTVAPKNGEGSLCNIFTITTEEGDGFGIYSVVAMNSDIKDLELKENDKIKIYGKIQTSEENKQGFLTMAGVTAVDPTPLIFVSAIEKL